MTSPRTRVDQLIALATNASASPEEARTAAMAAVKLIAQHKMLGGAPAPAQGGAAGMSWQDLINEVIRANRPSPPSASRPRPRPPAPKRVVIDECPDCKNTVYADQSSAYSAASKRHFHVHCANHGPCAFCKLTCYIWQTPLRDEKGEWIHQNCHVTRKHNPRAREGKPVSYVAPAKKPGLCRYCSDPYYIGEPVFPRPADEGSGFEHAVCYRVRVSGETGTAPEDRPRKTSSG